MGDSREARVGNIGLPELLVLLIAALVIFGPRRLPEIGRAVGEFLREFRRESQRAWDDLRQAVEEASREGPAPEGSGGGGGEPASPAPAADAPVGEEAGPVQTGPTASSLAEAAAGGPRRRVRPKEEARGAGEARGASRRGASARPAGPSRGRGARAGQAGREPRPRRGRGVGKPGAEAG